MQGERSKQEVPGAGLRHPRGRLGEATEVAALGSDVASPAAACISGTTIVIDGALEQQVSQS